MARYRLRIDHEAIEAIEAALAARESGGRLAVAIPALVTEVLPSPDPTVWIAYYSDWSGFSVFLDEVPCLRHAVAHSQSVVEVPVGVDPRDHLRGVR